MVQNTWAEKSWTSLRDLLVYYNLLDVNPFLEAVQKLLDPYVKDGFDIFKTSFSVSGVAKLKMLKETAKDTFFACFQKDMLIYTKIYVPTLQEVYLSFSQGWLLQGKLTSNQIDMKIPTK